MWTLWFLLGVLPFSLFSCFCFSHFSIVNTSIDEEIAVLSASCEFVYFARVNCCPVSLPLGVGGWLRLVIVTLPELY